MLDPVEITVDSEAVLLLATEPTGETLGKLTVTMRSERVRTLSSRELTYKLDHKPRWSYRADYDLDDEIAGLWRAGLVEDPDRRVAMPLWAHWILSDDYASRWLDAPYWMRTDTGAVVAQADIGALASGVELVPLVFGRVTRRPDVKAVENWIGGFSLVVEEDAPVAWAVSLVDRSLTSTSWPSDLLPSWSSVSETSRSPVEYKDLGQGREAVARGAEGLIAFRQTAEFVFDGLVEIATVLDFFRLQCGQAGVFIAPAWFQPGTVDTYNPIGYSARFASEELELEFTTPGLAEAKIVLVQVPDPAQSACVERPVYLYHLSAAVPAASGGPVETFLTSHESAISYDSDDYTPARIEHSSIEATLANPEQTTTLRVAMDDAPAVLALVLRESEAPITLTIYEAYASGSPTPARIFDGKLGDASLDDRIVEVKCGNEDGARFPSCRVQATDNLAAFSSGQGADPDDYDVAGTVETVLGPTIVGVDFAAGDSYRSDYFNWGVLEIGSGASWQRRIIVRQYPQTGDETDRIFELDRPLRDITPPVAMVAWPGYLGKWGYRLPDTPSGSMASDVVSAYYAAGYGWTDVTGYVDMDIYLDGPPSGTHAEGVFNGGFAIIRGIVYTLDDDEVGPAAFYGVSYARRVHTVPAGGGTKPLQKSKVDILLFDNTYTEAEVIAYAGALADADPAEGEPVEGGALLTFYDDGTYQNFLGFPHVPADIPQIDTLQAGAAKK